MNIFDQYIERFLFILLPFLSGALVVSLGLAMFGIPSYTPVPDTAGQAATVVLAAPSTSLPHALSEHLIAQSAIVYDVTEKKVLFAKDTDTPRPLASITKLMTALVAYDNVPHRMQIECKEQNGEVATSMLSLPDALAYLLVGSKNTETEEVAFAANTLLMNAAITPVAPQPVLPRSPETVQQEDSVSTRVFQDPNIPYFLEKVNTRARTLGMTKTHFYNSTGLDLSEREAGAYGSAQDIALLLAYLSGRSDLSFLEATTEPVFSTMTLSGEVVTTENTNEIVGAIPGLMFSKTGYTDLAGGNLAVVFDAGLNRPIAIVVLGSTLEGRFHDIKLLVDETLRTMQDQ